MDDFLNNIGFDKKEVTKMFPNMKYHITILMCLLLMTACSGQKSTAVQMMQKRDKYLSCQEVMLEINEAEFYRKTAEGNRGFKVQNILMPMGYYSTYISANEAVEASNSRVEYLNRIYEIMKCDDETSQVKASYQSQAPQYAPTYSQAAPTPQVQQYSPQAYGPAPQQLNGPGDRFYVPRAEHSSREIERIIERKLETAQQENRNRIENNAY